MAAKCFIALATLAVIYVQAQSESIKSSIPQRTLLAPVISSEINSPIMRQAQLPSDIAEIQIRNKRAPILGKAVLGGAFLGKTALLGAGALGLGAGVVGAGVLGAGALGAGALGAGALGAGVFGAGLHGAKYGSGYGQGYYPHYHTHYHSYPQTSYHYGPAYAYGWY